MTPSTAAELTALQSPHESLEHQLHFLLHTVSVSPLDDLGWVRVTGTDRVRWLNGMVTNSIQSLRPGQGNYSFALNAQGQIQGDLNTFAAADALLLQTARDRVPALMAIFDRFIIMDDVELADLSPQRFGLTVIGPAATALLQQLSLTPISPATPNTLSLVSHGNIDVIASHSPLVPRFELWTDEPTRANLLARLTPHLPAFKGSRVGPAALECLRLLEGTPRFGTDLHDKTLAQETGQTRALHFSKGCYLGQEIVERIRSRGNVHRIFTAFQLTGPLPLIGTSIQANGKPIAELTTAAAIALRSGTMQIGLGLARREALDRGASLTYTVGDTQGTAVPLSTPIQPSVQTT